MEKFDWFFVSTLLIMGATAILMNYFIEDKFAIVPAILIEYLIGSLISLKVCNDEQ